MTVAISTPKISVIVPVYNQRCFVPGLLSSLEKQDCAVPYEVIVCDDGSVDGTRELICSRPISNSFDLRYIWQPDLGFRVARARNNGIRCAQGEILVFVDGDSWLRPFFLSQHWEAHLKERRMVAGGVQNVKLSEKQIPADCATLIDQIPESAMTDLEERLACIDTDRPWMAYLTGNLSIRRADAILFDEQFQGWGSEDRDFAFRLYESGLTIHFLIRTGVIHLQLLDRSVEWNPSKGGNQMSIVAAMESKLRLFRKYPGEVMLPSLDLIRRCHLDRSTDTWLIGPPREDASIVDIFAEFEDWRARRSCRLAAPLRDDCL